MKIVRIECTKKDERGEITDILINEKIDYVTLITSLKGTQRGNHFHKETVQWVFIMDGKIKLITKMPNGPVVSSILEKNDLALTFPLESHAMIALEDSSFLVFTRGKRGGENYESDTYRLSEPLSD